jgi:hypothetical protein
MTPDPCFYSFNSFCVALDRIYTNQLCARGEAMRQEPAKVQLINANGHAGDYVLSINEDGTIAFTKSLAGIGQAHATAARWSPWFGPRRWRHAHMRSRPGRRATAAIVRSDRQSRRPQAARLVADI